MAQRRMFSLKVVDTDSFLDMSPTAQNLYFHLGMRADDDGFVSNPKKIQRMLGAPDDDIKVLIGKKFIIPMATNGVSVITHWKMNNLIKSDRYTETIYLEEKKRLVEKDGKYSSGYGDFTEFQNGSRSVPEVEPQVRLGKDRIEHTSDVSSQAFNLKESIKNMENNARRDINIIALFLDKKMPDIRSADQLNTTIKRHLRAAKLLSPFSDNQILDAIPKAERLTSQWTLETLTKILTK